MLNFFPACSDKKCTGKQWCRIQIRKDPHGWQDPDPDPPGRFADPDPAYKQESRIL